MKSRITRFIQKNMARGDLEVYAISADIAVASVSSASTMYAAFASFSTLRGALVGNPTLSTLTSDVVTTGLVETSTVSQGGDFFDPDAENFIYRDTRLTARYGLEMQWQREIEGEIVIHSCRLNPLNSYIDGALDLGTLSVQRRALFFGAMTFSQYSIGGGVNVSSTLYISDVTMGSALPRQADTTGLIEGQLYIDSNDNTVKIVPSA